MDQNGQLDSLDTSRYKPSDIFFSLEEAIQGVWSCALDKLCTILYVVSEGQFGKNGLLESFVLTHASTHINIDKIILGNIFKFLTI